MQTHVTNIFHNTHTKTWLSETNVGNVIMCVFACTGAGVHTCCHGLKVLHSGQGLCERLSKEKFEM